MARNDKISMPTSGGGLIRYFDDYHSKIEMKPVHALILIGLVVVLVFILYQFGVSMLGIA